MANRSKDNSLGVELRILRAKQGVSQGELAKVLGVDQATISRIENGKTSKNNLVRKAISTLGEAEIDAGNAEFQAISKELAHSEELRRLVGLVVRLYKYL